MAKSKIPLSQIMKQALVLLQDKPMGTDDIRICLKCSETPSLEDVNQAIQELEQAGKVRGDSTGMYFLTNG